LPWQLLLETSPVDSNTSRAVPPGSI